MAEDVILLIVKSHGRRYALIYIGHTQHSGIVIIECHPVKQPIVALQRLASTGQGFLIVAHLQIDACSQRIGRSLVGIEHVKGPLGQSGQSLTDILNNEVIDLLNRGLRVGGAHLGTGDQGHTTIGGSRSGVIGLSIIVHESEILHRP